MRVSTLVWRTAAVATAVTVPLLGVTVAQADTAPATTSSTTGATTGGTTDPEHRLDRACDRIPHRLARLQRVQTRFHAGVDTRGSIAFLEARIARAKADGHADLERLLSDRLAVRKDIDSQLPDILAKLGDAQQVCADHGAAAPAPKASS